MKLKNFLQRSHIILEKSGDDKIQVQGVGMYTYDTLVKKVEGMTKDLMKLNKKKNHYRVGRNSIKVYAAYWNALKKYEEEML